MGLQRSPRATGDGGGDPSSRAPQSQIQPEKSLDPNPHAQIFSSPTSPSIQFQVSGGFLAFSRKPDDGPRSLGPQKAGYRWIADSRQRGDMSPESLTAITGGARFANPISEGDRQSHRGRPRSYAEVVRQDTGGLYHDHSPAAAVR